MNKPSPTLRMLAVFMLLQTAMTSTAFAALVQVTTLTTDNTFAPGVGAAPSNVVVMSSANTSWTNPSRSSNAIILSFFL